MASVTSLGVHTPSALPYLVAEGILPSNPADNLYTWQSVTPDGLDCGEDLDLCGEEELLLTENCVAWSQSGVVRRLFRFDVEGERIVQAVFTWFPADESLRRANANGPGKGIRNGSATPPTAGWSSKAQSYNAQLGANGTNGNSNPKEGSPSSKPVEDRQRALVVFLKTQAHVYYLSGTSHVVHLPFEVDSVLPAPHGVIIQRRISASTLQSASQSAPPAPPNSFVSSQAQPWSAPSSQQAGFIAGLAPPPRLPVPTTSLLDDVISARQGDDKGLPRLFSLVDPLSEMGLVVAETSKQSRASGNAWDRTANEPVNTSEEMLYISTNDLTSARDEESPLTLALTINRETRMYTVWSVNYAEPETIAAPSRRRTLAPSGSQSRRRSSYAPGTGATTPNVRDSFGGSLRAQNPLASTHANIPFDKRKESKLDDKDELASQLDPDFNYPNAPAEQSRRVSSLLARADLSSSYDKMAFSDLASSHAGNTSFAGASRRGESFGGYSSRGSFGGIADPSRRVSVPGNKIYPNIERDEIPSDELLEGLDGFSDSEESDILGFEDSLSGLKKEVLMTKIQDFGIDQPQPASSFPLQGYQNTKVFTLAAPQGSRGTSPEYTFMCIHDAKERKLLVLTIEIRRQSNRKSSLQNVRPLAAVVDVKCGTGVLDAVKLTDGAISRILVLSETNDGHGELTLQAPWSALMKVELPSTLRAQDPYRLGLSFYYGDVEEVLGDEPRALLRLLHTSTNGKVDVLDDRGRRHRLQVQLQPRNEQVRLILDVCRFVLPGHDRAGEGILVAWWEVWKWLQGQKDCFLNDEWTSLVVVLFTMAVAFIDNGNSKLSVQQRKQNRVSTARTAAHSDANCEAMLNQESGLGCGPKWLKSPAWKWLDGIDDELPADASNNYPPAGKNPFLLTCSAFAREFLKTPSGKRAFDQQGYTPTAASRHPDIQRTALATTLVALHLVYENQKLNSSTSRKNELLPVLAQLGGWLGWESWSWGHEGYYGNEDEDIDQWFFEDTSINGLAVPPQPFLPPSIYEWSEGCFGDQKPKPFLSLLDIVSPSLSRESSLASSKMTPQTAVLAEIFSRANESGQTSSERVQAMVKAGISIRMLEYLPEGLVAPLRDAIISSQARPPTTWNAGVLDIIGRVDLRMLLQEEEPKVPSGSTMAPTHEATRDIHSVCNSTSEIENIGSFDGSAELDRVAVTRLIFREDRRFAEASKLLNQMKPTVARCAPEPEWSESDLLEAQKELAQVVAIRTLAVSSGRALLYYSARVPLLTERVPVSGFNLSCVMKPSNNTVTADKNAYSEEKIGWAFFHSGVAAGLSISREAKGIDTSWIVFNKPSELSNRHAGFLLALGLNGHLKSIAKWVAFKYLTPKHTMTSIGLLLGLSASYLGTMDTLVTRLLSVHVTRMLPPGAAELNLSPLTQTTGIMGIGLLYCNTQHRRMSEVMLSEIEHIDETLNPDGLRDEGYRLAAGFALGFINLGKGKDLKGLHDMHIVKRLLSLAVGNRKVSLVHVLDKATAAATIAIALIFMKTQDEALARKIDIPDTILQFDYVRPDIFLLRTLARHLIMWNDIEATHSWIRKCLPVPYRDKSRLKSKQTLSSEDMPFFNILAGLCFSIGLRFAGSRSLEVRKLLVHYLDQFTRLCRLPALNYDAKLTRSTVRNCQDIVALSAASVMAGTGDLHLFRRLRSLHGRVDPDTSYGSHLAAHVAIGVLFLGGGSYTFGTSNLAIASLVCAFYPLFPTSIMDNKSHLQAFRHFWVLATEARCLIARDVETHRPTLVSVTVTLRNGTKHMLNAPCLLPELDDIATIQTTSPEHWSVTLDFANNPSHVAAIRRYQTIYVRQRPAHNTHASVFSATLQALNASQTSQVGRQIFQWIFTLPAFAGLDQAERALVLPPDAGSPVHAGTEGTVVDDRLVLEKACLGSGERDRLWNLRVLFRWAEEVQARGERIKWLGTEVVEGLRAAVWMASRDVQ
ncbi:MAG: hypothetical protein M1819_000539 [Sarea resinae]|nr:MAG: hypothetical protein M1819_000539 [Sarea resinae]